MDPELGAAFGVLRERGLEIGERLGAGVEGTVFALGEGLVAKVWRARSFEDLVALRSFTEAVDTAGLPFAAPLVLDLIQRSGAPLITIERRLQGIPLRVGGQPSPAPISADESAAIVDVLAAFAAVPATLGMSALPLLPGEERESHDLGFPVRLALLVERRIADAGSVLRAELLGLDELAEAVASRLRAIDLPAPALVHGDLIPANVLVQDGRVSAVLDFGFLTAGGDPRFDAAVTASIFDMYGPCARTSERVLDEAFANRFGYDERTRAVYRAAYALATATCFGSGADDGHFRWCLGMLRRPEVLDAVGRAPRRLSGLLV